MSRKTFFDLITLKIKKLKIILKNFKFEITYLRLIYSRLEAVKKYFPPCNGSNNENRKNCPKKKFFKIEIKLPYVDPYALGS